MVPLSVFMARKLSSSTSWFTLERFKRFELSFAGGHRAIRRALCRSGGSAAIF